MFRGLVLAAMWSFAASWSCDDISSPTNSTLSLFSLGEVDALATCNDGSAAGYYFEEGSDSSTWLVYLGGGSWCYDEDSCAARWANGCPQSFSEAGYVSCMSNESFNPTCQKTGIFDRDPAVNPLAKVNMIYVPYCTSDGHMGNVGASNDTFGYTFRGARVVRALMADLVSRQKLGSSPATLIFGGGSAGARGTMTLLDEVASFMAEAVPLVTVVGIMDSPFIIDVSPFNSSFSGFANEHELIYSLANMTSVVPADCAAAYAGQEWRCVMGDYRMPFLQTPHLAMVYRFDSYQLQYNVWGGASTSDDFNDEQTAYVTAFGRLAHSRLQGIPDSNESAAFTTGVWSPACVSHHQSENSNFWTTATSEGVTMANAVSAFLGGASASSSWFDACTTPNCGSGC